MSLSNDSFGPVKMFQVFQALEYASWCKLLKWKDGFFLRLKDYVAIPLQMDKKAKN